MKLELKNIKVNLAFSEETTMFKADIYANGKKIGYADNDGHGGCTCYNAYEGQREALKAAEAFAQTLPSDFYQYGGEKREIKMNLEHWIDKQVDEHINAKERVKFEKKIQKMCETKIVWGVPNSGNVQAWGFKGNKLNLSTICLTPNGRIAVDNLVAKVKAELKDGEVIFNKNI